MLGNNKIYNKLNGTEGKWITFVSTYFNFLFIFKVEAGIFLFSTMSRSILKPSQFPVQWIWGLFSRK